VIAVTFRAMRAPGRRASVTGPVASAVTRRAHAVAVAIGTAAVATLYSVFSLGGQRHFETNAYDLGIFDQAVAGYSRFGAPLSLVKGVHNGFGTHFSVLGDHFSPILAVLGPFYRVFPHVQTLLIAQAVLFALSVPFVWMFTRRALGTLPAYLIALGYSLSWCLQGALADDFHEIAFAVPLIAIAIERLDAGKIRTAVIAAALLLLVKEDLGPVVALFGLVIGLRTRRWKTGLVLFVAAIVVTVIEVDVLIPAAGGRPGYYWTYYAALGSGPAAALWHVVRHPASTLHLLVTPAQKVRLLEWLFLPLGLASLGSSIVLLAVSPIAELVASANDNQWQLVSHYTAVLAPILTLAAVDTVAKLLRLVGARRVIAAGRPRAARRVTAILGAGYAAGVLMIALWACARMPFDQLSQHWWWHTDQVDVAARAAVAQVPNGATVEASDHLVPHLVDRAKVMLLDATPHNAPWVVIDEGRVDWPLTPWEQQTRIGWLTTHGYHEVFARSHFVVYYRGSTGA